MDKRVPLLKRGEQAVPAGEVLGGYNRLKVAGVNPDQPIAVQDTLIFCPAKPSKRHKPYRLTVTSLEIDYLPVMAVQPGQLCGIELGCSCSELPQEGDQVFLVRPKPKSSDS